MKKISVLCALFLVLAGCTARTPAAVSPTPALTPMAPSLPPVETAPVTPAPVETTVVTPPVETAPAAETQSPAESLAPTEALAWDGSLETLTLADFPTSLSMSADIGADDRPLYLVAQLPEEDTWLYGWHGPQQEQGLILRLGDSWQFFNISYFTARGLLPQMAYGDFDGDLSLELALQVYDGGGTGISVWGLHIVELEEDGLWTAHYLSPDDYGAILSGSVTGAYDHQTGLVTASAGEALLELPLTLSEGAQFRGFTFGQQVSYTVTGDGVTASFGGWVDADGLAATSTYLLTVNADVIYTGTMFGLSNLTLAPI